MKRKALVVVLTALGFSTMLTGVLLASDETPSADRSAEDTVDMFLIATSFAGVVAVLTLVINGLIGRHK